MKHKCALVFHLREQFDTTSAAGEMVLYTIANIAQFERRQTAERTAANFQARAERGLYNGGSIPFGYERHPENKGYLIVNSDDATIVREAFATFLKEGSIATAGKSLNERGYRMKMARDGGGLKARLGHFTADNLYGVLTNRAYIGLRSFKVKGEERTSKAVWNAIIDEDTFNKTQAILKKNYRRLKTTMNKRYPFILSGITFCATCGDRMPGKSAHGNGGKYPYYEHGWATKRQAYLSKKVFACDPHRVSATTFEKLVWNEIEKLFHHQDFAAAIISHAYEMHKKQGNLLEVEKFRGKVKALEDQVEALAEHLLKIPKTLSPLPVYRQMERVAQVKEQAEKELQRLEAETYVRDVPIALKDYKSYIANLKDLLSDAEKHDLRAKIVSRLIYKIEIKPKGFRLYYFVGKRELSRDDQDSMKPAKPPIALSPENKKGVELTSAPFLKSTGSNTLDSGRGDWT